jgi:hypothetical protein
MPLPRRSFVLLAACSALMLAADAAFDPNTLKPDAPVAVREGDSWSKATFVKKEGR